MTMKNITVLVLSVLLAVAVVVGIIMYQQNLGIKSSLQNSDKKLRDLSENVIPSRNVMIAKLQEDLKNIEQKVLELENTLSMKDEKLSEAKEKLLVTEGHLEEERKTQEDFSTELSSRDAVIEKLQKDLKGSQSQIELINNKFARKEGEIEEVHHQLSDLKGQKALAESKIDNLKSTYEALISDLNKQVENREVTIRAFEEKISVTFVDSVLFDLGKATITEEGRRNLKGVGDILKKVQSKQIRIIGHTDNISIQSKYHYKFPTNWELSTARAAAVVRYFQNEINLDPRNLEAVGRSFYEPITGNNTEAGRAQNRRVNIIIAPKAE